MGADFYTALFRTYDPAIGRWWQIDPIDKEDLSPYSWVTNNPLLYGDPFGLDSIPVNELDFNKFNPNEDVVVLEEVTIQDTYTGPKAEDSPNVNHALGILQNSITFGRTGTGRAEPFYFVTNPVEAAISVSDNLLRGDILMAGAAGFAFLPGGKTIRGTLKTLKLPVSGKIRFIPPKNWNPSRPLPKGPKNGYIDRFGNEWLKPKGQLQGEFHWDVQLSKTGKEQIGHLSNSGKHVNITQDGRVAH